jgi:hypothetical protein
LTLQEKTLQEKINDVNKILKFEIREGYIDKNYTNSYDNTNMTVRIFVTELDRYTNGKSKIALKDIHLLKNNSDINKQDILYQLRSHLFKDIEDTKSIEWLESVNEIQRIRQEKLKRVLDGK